METIQRCRAERRRIKERQGCKEVIHTAGTHRASCSPSGTGCSLTKRNCNMCDKGADHSVLHGGGEPHSIIHSACQSSGSPVSCWQTKIHLVTRCKPVRAITAAVSLIFRVILWRFVLTRFCRPLRRCRHRRRSTPSSPSWRVGVRITDSRVTAAITLDPQPTSCPRAGWAGATTDETVTSSSSCNALCPLSPHFLFKGKDSILSTVQLRGGRDAFVLHHLQR